MHHAALWGRSNTDLLCMQLEQCQTPTLLRTPQGATSPAPAQTVLSQTVVMAAKSKLAKVATG